MRQTVLLGDPSHFRIKAGANPHTRDRFGRRKRVNLTRAIAQWHGLQSLLEAHGMAVHVLPPVEEEPGMVFPANAGFRYGSDFYLSNLNPHRTREREHYRQKIGEIHLTVRDLPAPYPFEGQADFIPLGFPSGDSSKTVYLFTYGRICRQRWVPRWGLPPYRRIYGFRSDQGALAALQAIVGEREILPLELVDEAHYHGDTVFCSFGRRRELLLAYLNALSADARALLRRRFGDRLIPLDEEDGRQFAANSFQIIADYHGEKVPLLVMPDGLTEKLYHTIRSHGVIPCPVDVSEFSEKGGGSVKCMLLDLGEF